MPLGHFILEHNGVHDIWSFSSHLHLCEQFPNVNVSSNFTFWSSSRRAQRTEMLRNKDIWMCRKKELWKNIFRCRNTWEISEELWKRFWLTILHGGVSVETEINFYYWPPQANFVWCFQQLHVSQWHCNNLIETKGNHKVRSLEPKQRWILKFFQLPPYFHVNFTNMLS